MLLIITMGITDVPMVDVTITMVITRWPVDGYHISGYSEMSTMEMMETNHTRSVVDGLEPRAGGAELRCTWRWDNSIMLCPTTRGLDLVESMCCVGHHHEISRMRCQVDGVHHQP